ncbi:AraC family transcriptional regulator [Roseibium sp.]|uniref:AraC family transcriptional regulator n=1 Tax=Roseibium sp. TaxID=1936156 RepID=UPI003A9746B3
MKNTNRNLNQSALVSMKVLLSAVVHMQSLSKDWKSIAEKAGIPLSNFADPSLFVSLESSLRFCELAATSVGDDSFGVAAGAATKIGDGRIFDYFVLSAPTVRQALNNWVRFQATRTNAVDIGVQIEDGKAFLNWGISDIFGPRTQFCGMLMAFSATRIRHMLAQEDPALIVEFTHSEPSNIDEYHRVFGPGVTFNRDHDRVGFDTKYLDIPLPTAEPTLFSIIEDAALNELRQRQWENTDLIRISKQVGNSLKQGDMTLDTVARDLGMSKRTLQRTLEGSNTSFRQLVDDVRRELAGRYLTETDLPMSEITFLLGYSELSVFSRAAKGWFGMPPKAYRQERMN